MYQLGDDNLLQRTQTWALQEKGHWVGLKEVALQGISTPHVQPRMLQEPSEKQYNSPEIQISYTTNKHTEQDKCIWTTLKRMKRHKNII